MSGLNERVTSLEQMVIELNARVLAQQQLLRLLLVLDPKLRPALEVQIQRAEGQLLAVVAPDEMVDQVVKAMRDLLGGPVAPGSGFGGSTPAV